MRAALYGTIIMMPISELKELLEQSGLVFDAVYDAYTDDQVKCDSEKVTVIAHKA